MLFFLYALRFCCNVFFPVLVLQFFFLALVLQICWNSCVKCGVSISPAIQKHAVKRYSKLINPKNNRRICITSKLVINTHPFYASWWVVDDFFCDIQWGPVYNWDKKIRALWKSNIETVVHFSFSIIEVWEFKEFLIKGSPLRFWPQSGE